MRRFLFLFHPYFIPVSRNHQCPERLLAERFYRMPNRGFCSRSMQKQQPLYQDLLKWDPDNDNLKYKIGICLLNDPFQKDRVH